MNAMKRVMLQFAAVLVASQAGVFAALLGLILT